jgi:hypothetical protein
MNCEEAFVVFPEQDQEKEMGYRKIVDQITCLCNRTPSRSSLFKTSSLLVSFFAFVFTADLLFAEGNERKVKIYKLPVNPYHQGSEKKIDIHECQPVYGYYWRSYKGGWYGARREVKTPVEAREIVETIFSPRTGIRVTRVFEKKNYFITEIVNRQGVAIELLLIDKRTGRIRSMF